ncbi:Rdx family-domain-containing protein [Xylariaceae sp. FL1019]|nr:Rdx family-domain-containing protein [Xylariaceae sp. FL1019]
MADNNSSQISASCVAPLPRITIRFCTQCKWMLRAAYFAQELLSTFSTSLGEVALQPATGGVFIVEIFYSPIPSSDQTPITPQSRVLWDRKIDGGFPETKELKRRVRDVIEPGRNLGHVDRDYPKGGQAQQNGTAEEETKQDQVEMSESKDAGTAQRAGEVCEDCQ